jgi:hypothetical protein
MWLAASVFLTVLVVVAGCQDAEPTTPQLAAYYLEKAWAESKPTTDRDELTVPAGARVVRLRPACIRVPGRKRQVGSTQTLSRSVRLTPTEANELAKEIRSD